MADDRRAISARIGRREARIYLSRESRYEPRLAEDVELWRVTAIFGRGQRKEASRRTDGTPTDLNRVEFYGETITDVFEQMATLVRANEARILELIEADAEVEGGGE